MNASQTHFSPANEREHQKGNAGYDVPDYCRNCRHPFMEHTNGVCPANEDEPMEPQRQTQTHPELGEIRGCGRTREEEFKRNYFSFTETPE